MVRVRTYQTVVLLLFGVGKCLRCFSTYPACVRVRNLYEQIKHFETFVTGYGRIPFGRFKLIAVEMIRVFTTSFVNVTVGKRARSSRTVVRLNERPLRIKDATFLREKLNPETRSRRDNGFFPSRFHHFLPYDPASHSLVFARLMAFGCRHHSYAGPFASHVIIHFDVRAA